MSQSQSTQPISSQESGSSRTKEVIARSDDRGTTTIDDGVVAKIAGIATREVGGVASMGGTLSGAVAEVVGRIRGEEHATSGVGVEVGTRQAAVDLSITVQYPAVITEVASSVRDNVIDRIEKLTGLEVVEVNIAVADLAFPGGEEEGDQSRVE
ncbi:Asp23/Gls24 family envelope stress response protein [Nitriliruptor alkaliphilus]|uniref:Asp23/Gls24 family envelope stress response protein n=1 Tax=Nitriliruptor alkaliphilus TaxID=427918 RepID=UPI000696BEFE|nr:Asp23/Gls24 family envelope stress response protein [Nitriliruptor alkaliphilus]